MTEQDVIAGITWEEGFIELDNHWLFEHKMYYTLEAARIAVLAQGDYEI